MKASQPPLGVKPREIWMESRLEEIEDAIGRRLGTQFGIPPAWLDERNDLVREIHSSAEDDESTADDDVEATNGADATLEQVEH